jgi:hypothetical protein
MFTPLLKRDRLSGSPRARWRLVSGLVVAGLAVFVAAVSLGHAHVNGSTQFARAAYCSVPGNTAGDGSALQPGTFLDLNVGAPQYDVHYVGATPANFVEGSGLTCSAPPAGYVRRGLASDQQNVIGGIYPYFIRSR